ncbi:proline-rich receptor-like protein kinase PERK10 [Cryptomeria japonica]|uniref:proline-rich receptor-like protein kinase PERK10 n=1 Tax=Cryptomeria japonica TaxID=3369 RepID=UPI0027DAA2BA|nr:proline-rich receptor-like protein kinase PERK10 [Cryptomeria japonica]
MQAHAACRRSPPAPPVTTNHRSTTPPATSGPLSAPSPGLRPPAAAAPGGSALPAPTVAAPTAARNTSARRPRLLAPLYHCFLAGAPHRCRRPPLPPAEICSAPQRHRRRLIRVARPQALPPPKLHPAQPGHRSTIPPPGSHQATTRAPLPGHLRPPEPPDSLFCLFQEGFCFLAVSWAYEVIFLKTNRRRKDGSEPNLFILVIFSNFVV